MKPLFLSCQKVQKFKMPSPHSITRAALGTESELNQVSCNIFFTIHFPSVLLTVFMSPSLQTKGYCNRSSHFCSNKTQNYFCMTLLVHINFTLQGIQTQ